MVTIGMNYVVREGKGELFEHAFRKVLHAMQSMDGHSESHLYRDVADPCRYVILSVWSDEGAFRHFIQSKQFAAVTNWGKEEILAGRPTHHVYSDRPLH